MLQIVTSHFLVEFYHGKMCACHLKIIFKHMEKSFVLAKCGNLVRNGLTLYKNQLFFVGNVNGAELGFRRDKF